uniref:Uncharacterized protein n=1 Tax=Tetraodon nigroviridis TaxID=99883 RepID=H3CWR7_TETNG
PAAASHRAGLWGIKGRGSAADPLPRLHRRDLRPRRRPPCLPSEDCCSPACWRSCAGARRPTKPPPRTLAWTKQNRPRTETCWKRWRSFWDGSRLRVPPQRREEASLCVVWATAAPGGSGLASASCATAPEGPAATPTCSNASEDEDGGSRLFLQAWPSFPGLHRSPGTLTRRELAWLFWSACSEQNVCSFLFSEADEGMLEGLAKRAFGNVVFVRCGE